MAYGTFNHGGATYPLTSDVSQSLLRDADPAVYYALEYFASIIETHVGDRLLSQARQNDITAITKVIAAKIPYDPRPWLQEVQVPFPLLSVYRVASKYGVAASSWMRNAATWQVTYTLPSLTAAQMEQVGPILHAIESVLLNRIENMGDEEFQSGAEVWELAGIEEISLDSASFGTFVAGSNILLPTWIGTLTVRERDMPAPDGAFDGVFTGIDAVITSQSGNEPPVEVVDMKVDIAAATIGSIASLRALFVASEGVRTAGDTNEFLANWTNQVSGGNAMVPTAVQNRPRYGLDADTGVPVVFGDGALAQLSAIVSSMGADTGKTIVVAFRLWDVAERSTLALVTSTATIGTLAIEANTISTVGGRLGLYASASSFDTQFATDTDWHIAVVRVSASVGSIASTTRMQVDDQPAVLTLRSGSGTWASLATATNFGVLGLETDIAATAASAGIGVAMAFNAELSDEDTATAVAYCKQWLREQQQQ
jgi:hypothetical protein